MQLCYNLTIRRGNLCIGVLTPIKTSVSAEI